MELDEVCPSCGSRATVGSRPYTFDSNDPFGGLSVISCGDCGTARASPMPTDEALDGYYSSDEYESVEGSSLSFGTNSRDVGPARAAAQVRMVSKWTSRR